METLVFSALIWDEVMPLASLFMHSHVSDWLQTDLFLSRAIPKRNWCFVFDSPTCTRIGSVLTCSSIPPQASVGGPTGHCAPTGQLTPSTSEELNNRVRWDKSLNFLFRSAWSIYYWVSSNDFLLGIYLPTGSSSGWQLALCKEINDALSVIQDYIASN
jgi:hypothetical protein